MKKSITYILKLGIQNKNKKYKSINLKILQQKVFAILSNLKNSMFIKKHVYLKKRITL